jgi:hypothetical protein
MKKITSLLPILIIILIVIVIFQNFTMTKSTPATIKIDGRKYNIIKEVIDTVDVEKVKYIKKGKDTVYLDTIIYIRVPVNIDTLAIIKDYFAKRVYKDTLFLPDSLGFVSIVDTITKNSIESRIFNAKVKERIIRDTKIVKDPPKNQLFVGLNSQFGGGSFVTGIGGSLIFKSKDDKLYQLGTGITNNNLKPYINGGIYWKIKLKKD